MRVGLIDIGTNTTKILIADYESSQSLVEIDQTAFPCRLIHQDGDLETIEPSSIDILIRCLSTLAAHAKKKQVTHLFAVATEGLRRAKNSPQIISQVTAKLGIKITILSGMEEAGAIAEGLLTDPNLSELQNFFALDIGGGSLELIRFAHGQIEQALSLQLGAVRLTEQFIADRDAALSAETAARIAAHVSDALQSSGFSFEPNAAPLIVTGGAFTVTRAVLAAQNDQTIKQRCPVLHKEEITELKAALMALPLHERMAVPHLPAARADIIPAALITIDSVLEYAARDRVTHSFYNLRYGIAAELLS